VADHSIPGALIDGFDAAAEALQSGWTLPARWYSDPAIYDFEVRHILRRRWHVAGSLARLANSGDHIVCTVAETPIVVTRDERGRLHGFVNLCRHRGHPVAESDGNRKTLQCRFHGWTYGLDGTLRRVPGIDIADPEHLREFGAESQGIFSDQLCQLSLRPVQVHTWNSVVFVNLDVEGHAFHEAHPDFTAIVDSIGLDFAEYRFHKTYVFEVAANWKLWFENGVECYHCPTVHQSTFSSIVDVSLESFKVRWHGDVISTWAGARADAARAVDANGEPFWRSVHVFPGTFIGQDDDAGIIAQTVATGPETSLFQADMYMNVKLDDTSVKEWAEIWEQVVSEDLGVVGRQHAALRSGGISHGRWMPWREGASYQGERLALQAYEKALLENAQAVG